jgi:hypothetical protein
MSFSGNYAGKYQVQIAIVPLDSHSWVDLPVFPPSYVAPACSQERLSRPTRRAVPIRDAPREREMIQQQPKAQRQIVPQFVALLRNPAF